MFPIAYFDFFRDLSTHNDRDWFQANKPRYERDVRDVLLRFIEQVAEPMARISPHIQVDPRPNGGSMFRIYRDTRFSADKTPYKTHGAAQFRHAAGKDVHGPGYYVHLGPGEVFSGGGMWRPEPDVARKVRDRIVSHADEWSAAKAAMAPRTLSHDSYKKVPAGYDPTHPHVTDLKRKDFVTGSEYGEADATRKDFLDRFLADCRAMAPFMRFLAVSGGLPF